MTTTPINEENTHVLKSLGIGFPYKNETDRQISKGSIFLQKLENVGYRINSDQFFIGFPYINEADRHLQRSDPLSLASPVVHKTTPRYGHTRQVDPVKNTIQ